MWPDTSKCSVWQRMCEYLLRRKSSGFIPKRMRKKTAGYPETFGKLGIFFWWTLYWVNKCGVVAKSLKLSIIHPSLIWMFSWACLHAVMKAVISQTYTHLSGQHGICSTSHDAIPPHLLVLCNPDMQLLLITGRRVVWANHIASTQWGHLIHSSAVLAASPREAHLSVLWLRSLRESCPALPVSLSIPYFDFCHLFTDWSINL